MGSRNSATWWVCGLSVLLGCAESRSRAEGQAGVGVPQPRGAAPVPPGVAPLPAEAAPVPPGVAPTPAEAAPQLPGVAPRPEAQAPQLPGVAPPRETQAYAGYLFIYFVGEGRAQGEQIYFALSRGNDPLSWQELNRGEPVLTSSVGTNGVRDPFIIRSPDGGRFYLIATDLKMFGDGNWDRAQRQGSKSIVVWESTDLVTWTDQRLVRVAPDSAGNTWAPEAFFDDSIGAYVVFWAAAVYAPDDPGHAGNTYNRMLYATTQDFRTFSEPQVWHDPGYAIIDSTVIEVDDTFYRFTKDERANAAASPCGKFITLETSLSLTNTRWALSAECIGRGTVSRGEGPLVFKSNTEQKWYLFIDEFGGRGYVPFESTDLRSGAWVVSPQYSLPASPRHGTVLPVNAEENQRLLQAFAPN